MNEAAKEARRAYKRKWQRENKDKVKEYQARYWERKAQAQEAANNNDGDPADAEPAQEG